MEQIIVGFEQDEVGDWRAILACGHRQHVRHNPPLVERPWVQTAEGRHRFLGFPLDCKRCDEEEATPPSGTIHLREVQPTDLPIFFDHQRDPQGVYMAAFTTKDPEDRAAFDYHWAHILADEDNLIRTIIVDGAVAGSVSSYVGDIGPEVTYWLGREFWGRGIATAALAQFLRQQATRPIYARAATDNTASLRVLAKCGFVIIGQSQGYANARGQEIREYTLELQT